MLYIIVNIISIKKIFKKSKVMKKQLYYVCVIIKMFVVCLLKVYLII